MLRCSLTVWLVLQGRIHTFDLGNRDSTVTRHMTMGHFLQGGVRRVREDADPGQEVQVPGLPQYWVRPVRQVLRAQPDRALLQEPLRPRSRTRYGLLHMCQGKLTFGNKR